MIKKFFKFAMNLEFSEQGRSKLEGFVKKYDKINIVRCSPAMARFESWPPLRILSCADIGY